ncbi:MAG: hypothetical protein WCD57_04275 [Acidobacteriaceae bacterium]
MKFASATNINRKSGVAERRDLCVEAPSWKCLSSDLWFLLLPCSAFSVGSQAVFRLCSRMSTRLLAFFFLVLSAAGVRAAEPSPIPVKVVVISLFEPGADQGDTPGEYQYWVERDQPPAGLTAAQSLAANAGHRYSAYLPALEAAYRVGNVVVSNIVTNWDRYQDHIPGSQPKEKP